MFVHIRNIKIEWHYKKTFESWLITVTFDDMIALLKNPTGKWIMMKCQKIEKGYKMVFIL